LLRCQQDADAIPLTFATPLPGVTGSRMVIWIFGFRTEMRPVFVS